MNRNEFLEIENELNVHLPEEYINLVLSNPFKDKKYDKIKDALFVDKETIIEVNKKVCANGYLSKSWPKNLFIIGAGREDAYSVIDIKKNNNIIYAIIPEDQQGYKNIKKVREANSYKEFIETEKLFIDI